MPNTSMMELPAPQITTGHALRARDVGPVAATLAAIWQRHREPMLARIATLERAAIAVLRGALDGELRAQAQAEARELSDALRALGLTSASNSAGRVERLLAGEPDARALSEQVVALRTDLELRDRTGAGEPPESAANGGQPSATVLIVSRDLGVAERLAAEAALSGLRAELALTPAEARTVAQRRRPDVVLLDLGADGQRDSALELLSELGDPERPLPVVVLAVRDAFSDRIEVARRGGRALLMRSLDPRRVIDEALQLVPARSTEPTTVLAVDQDLASLGAIRAILEPAGHRVVTLREPLCFWNELERVGPDVVLLEVDMPDLGGIELCRIVRSDRRWAALPVLLSSRRGDARLIRDVFNAGADDFVGRPFIGEELVARIKSRLERARLHRLLAERDACTGVPNRASSVQAIERLLALCKRYGDPVTLAVIDIDRFKAVNDRHGHAAGDAVLRRLADLLARSFRGEDVVGRWTGAEFVVGMYGMARHDALRRMRDLQTTFASERFAEAHGPGFYCTFSAGLAVFREDADDLHALHGAADEALRAAKAAGGRRVNAAGGKDDADAAERVDVVVVEADPVLSEVLVHALSTRGHKARVLCDGAEAAAALAAERPTLRARVVLLDVDLPALDGVAVLRRLHTAGVLRRTNVIMLTGRTGERTVLETLGLGAFDHLAKPFSLPVVMSKVARALEARPSSRTAF